jgi:hypothetical protein
MSLAEIRSVFDAHDALVRDCAEGRLTFGEFLGAYGDFPHGYGDTTRAQAPQALRSFRGRVAFHRQVAGVISGLRAAPGLGSMEDSEVGDFLPAVGLMRLRELVARYPKFEATGGGDVGELAESSRSR